MSLCRASSVGAPVKSRAIAPESTSIRAISSPANPAKLTISPTVILPGGRERRADAEDQGHGEVDAARVSTVRIAHQFSTGYCALRHPRAISASPCASRARLA